jgi:hypothetical protein
MRETRLRTVGWLCALGLMLAVRAQAQDSHLPGWLVAVGGTALDFKGDRSWGFGPTLGIRRMLSHRVALELQASDLVTNSGSRKFTSCVLGTFGPSFVWRGGRHDFAVSMGVIAGTLWEQQGGGQASTVGVYGALGGAYWFGPLGVTARLGSHIWYGDPGAEIIAGIAVRF